MLGVRWLSKSSSASAPPTSPEPLPVVRVNPLFWDDEEEENPYTSDRANNTRPLLYWNSSYVTSMEVGQMALVPTLLLPLDSDRSLTSTTAALSLRAEGFPLPAEDAQSQNSSDIDEELFDMTSVLSFQPRITKVVELQTPFAHELHEEIIRELSEKLALSKERQLLSTVISKSERFNSIRQSAPELNFIHPSFTAELEEKPTTTGQNGNCTNKVDQNSASGCSTSWMNNEKHMMSGVTESTSSGNKTFVTLSDAQSQQLILPILKELDQLLSNSKTLQTFKMKVKRAQEHMLYVEDGSQETASSETEAGATSSPDRRSRLCNKSLFPNTKRRVCQVGIAIFLSMLFLAMLVGLSICCSGKKS